MAAHTLNILTPSVNNLSARILVRAGEVGDRAGRGRREGAIPVGIGGHRRRRRWSEDVDPAKIARLHPAHGVVESII